MVKEETGINSNQPFVCAVAHFRLHAIACTKGSSSGAARLGREVRSGAGYRCGAGLRYVCVTGLRLNRHKA